MSQLINWGRRNHALLMIICCAVPMAVLVAAVVFNVPLGTIGIFLVMLICPLTHVFLMRGMMHSENSGQSCHSTGNQDAETNGKQGTSLQLAGDRKDK